MSRPRSPLGDSSGPEGPLKDVATIDVSSADFEDDNGFIVQVGGAGVLKYETLAGSTVTVTLAANGFPNVCGIPVKIRKVFTDTTTATDIIGGWQ